MFGKNDDVSPPQKFDTPWEALKLFICCVGFARKQGCSHVRAERFFQICARAQTFKKSIFAHVRKKSCAHCAQGNPASRPGRWPPVNLFFSGVVLQHWKMPLGSLIRDVLRRFEKESNKNTVFFILRSIHPNWLDIQRDNWLRNKWKNFVKKQNRSKFRLEMKSLSYEVSLGSEANE